MKSIKLLSFLFFSALGVKIINEFSFWVSRFAYGYLSLLDPDNVFLIITIHHILQALIALLILWTLVKRGFLSWPDLGFSPFWHRKALRLVAFFVLLWFLIQIFAGVILVRFFNEPIVFAFPLNSKNFIMYLLFQILLSGTSEELIYRVLIFSAAGLFLKNSYREPVFGVLLIAFSTLIFMFDHINFSFSPFRISHINYLQQATLLVFGCFYGWLYLRYNNYWSIAIAHNLLNGIILGSTLLLYFIFR